MRQIKLVKLQIFRKKSTSNHGLAVLRLYLKIAVHNPQIVQMSYTCENLRKNVTRLGLIEALLGLDALKQLPLPG
jgi:hypothetical protein